MELTCAPRHEGRLAFTCNMRAMFIPFVDDTCHPFHSCITRRLRSHMGYTRLHIERVQFVPLIRT